MRDPILKLVFLALKKELEPQGYYVEPDIDHGQVIAHDVLHGEKENIKWIITARLAK